MSNEAPWLERLSRASSYRDLQEVLDGMLSAAAQSDPIDFSSQIDEAIERLERERAYDQRELSATQEDYAEFRKGKSGVVGWLKRKMPFSETRKQEKQHLEAIEQQRVEVATDNFIIARAQMLKERILPSAHRKFGRRLEELRQLLQTAIADSKLPSLAVYCSELRTELERISEVLALLKADIETFVQAPISDRDMQQWREREVGIAKKELEFLSAEEHAKKQFRGDAIKRLSELVHRDLFVRAPDYRQTIEHAQQIREARAAANATSVLASKLGKLLSELDTMTREYSGLPNRRSTLQRDVENAQDAVRRSEPAFQNAQSQFKSAQHELEVAGRNRDVAKAAFEATKSAYESSQPKTAQAEVTAFSDFFDSPVMAQHARHKQEFELAEANANSASTAFQHAKQRFDAVDSEHRKYVHRLEELNNSLNALEQKERELRDGISTKQRMELELIGELSNSMRGYGVSLGPLHWLPSHQKLSGIPEVISHRTTFSPAVYAPNASRDYTRSVSSEDILRDRTAVAQIESSVRSDCQLLEHIHEDLMQQIGERLLQHSTAVLEPQHHQLAVELQSFTEHIVVQRIS